MNQDQNNFNQNNFNIQGSNGVSNNQPLNNQNPNQNMSANQQPMNQVNIAQPVPQPMNNTFNSGNVNQSINIKPPKKNNLWLIIGIVLVLIIGAIIYFFVINPNKGGLSIGNKNNNYCQYDGEMVYGAEYVNGQYTYTYSGIETDD